MFEAEVCSIDLIASDGSFTPMALDQRYPLISRGISVRAMGGKVSFPFRYARIAQTIGLQPFNKGYVWLNTSANLIIPNASMSALNTYIGGSYQQATSVITTTGMCPCHS